jgi:hypothetical protein
LAIHRRHYETSLVAALMEKFPAVTWLLGAGWMADLARDFVHRRPPAAPCIAEYGEDFAEFLGGCAGAGRLPYLRAFAALEWRIGRVAIAIDASPLALAAFVGFQKELPDLPLMLQPGLHYLASDWPIDELMQLYLGDAAPDQYAFAPLGVNLEIRGARGEFQITRLEAASYRFRDALARGLTIGQASEDALGQNSGFGPGRALSALVADGLVTGIGSTQKEHP